MAIWATAFDKRIRAAVSNCGCVNYRDSLTKDAGIQMAFCVPGILLLGDLEDVLRLAAPRALLIQAAEDDKSSGTRYGGRRSGFARLVFRGWFGSAILGVGRCPLLLSLQLLVVSSFFGAITLGTLEAIIRFAHQQSPDDFELRPRAPFIDARLAAAFRRSPRSVTLALEPFAHSLAVSTDPLGPFPHASL
jgi:hypothetical protein